MIIVMLALLIILNSFVIFKKWLNVVQTEKVIMVNLFLFLAITDKNRKFEIWPYLCHIEL